MQCEKHKYKNYTVSFFVVDANLLCFPLVTRYVVRKYTLMYSTYAHLTQYIYTIHHPLYSKPNVISSTCETHHQLVVAINTQHILYTNLYIYLH